MYTETYKYIIASTIHYITIDCPACAGLTDDEQYFCPVCNCNGGDGIINVVDYIKNNPEILKEE